MRLFLAVALLVPAFAAAESRDGEGTVVLAPTARLAREPEELGPLPGFSALFGYRPSASWEIGIDVAAAVARRDGYRLWMVPLGLSFDWILAPQSDVRPFLGATVARTFISADGPGREKVREYVPTTFQLSAGGQLDLSDDWGLLAEGGWLLGARADDGPIGALRLDGPFARVGLVIRVAPDPSRRR